MFFRAAALLAVSASVIAHPHNSRHRHHFKPSGSGNMVVPTGGMYGMGNNTSVNGTGFASGTSAYKTGTTSNMPVSTDAAVPSDVVADSKVADSASDASCDVSSEITTTVYTTDLVTMTITPQKTATAQESAVVSDTASADAASADALEVDDAEDDQGEADYSPAPAPSTASASEESSVEETSSTTLEMSGEAPESSSATTDSPAEPTNSALALSEEGYSSNPEAAAGAFYEVPGPESAAPSTPSSPPPSPPSTGYSTGGKRGLAYNSAELTNAFQGTPVSWAYNWAAAPGGDLDTGIEYVPMLWGPKAFGAWDAVAKSAVAAGAKHMLSFNEPDLGAQANMDSGSAAEAHIKYMNPYADGIQIGSPAVTSGGPDGGTDGMGLTWMQKFLDKCAGKCKVDFLAVHWYGSAEDAEWLKKHIDEAVDMAKKNGVNRVWLTEFGVSGSDDQVAKFLEDVMPWLDSKDGVERYAFFMCADGHLISGNAMSDPVGKTYAS